MKSIIVPVALLRASELCRAKDDVRYYLNGIFINNDIVCGTNGHVLFWCQWGDCRTEINESEAADVSKGVIIRIHSKIPARHCYARLTLVSDDMGVIEYLSPAMKKIGLLGAFSIIKGEYPDIRKVTDKFKSDPVAVSQISFNQNYIALTGKVFSCVNRRGYAKSTFFGEHEAMLVQDEHVEFGVCSMAVMPARSEK